MYTTYKTVQKLCCTYTRACPCFILFINKKIAFDIYIYIYGPIYILYIYIIYICGSVDICGFDNVVSSIALKVSETKRLNFVSKVDDGEEFLGHPSLRNRVSRRHYKKSWRRRQQIIKSVASSDTPTPTRQRSDMLDFNSFWVHLIQGGRL